MLSSERFHQGSVITVPNRADRAEQSGFTQSLAECPGSTLRAVIGTQDGFLSGRPAPENGDAECVDGQFHFLPVYRSTSR
jgi:hypothetical protein